MPTKEAIEFALAHCTNEDERDLAAVLYDHAEEAAGKAMEAGQAYQDALTCAAPDLNKLSAKLEAWALAVAATPPNDLRMRLESFIEVQRREIANGKATVALALRGRRGKA